MSAKILIVDDDPVIRLLVEECLSAHGFEVQSLPSGQECLDHLSRNTTDVVLLDMFMPGMNGVDVLKALKQTPNLSHLPVLMLSALSNTEQMFQGEPELRPDGVVQKPFKVHAILDAVRSVQPKDG